MSSRALVAVGLLLPLCSTLGGCSMSFPMGSMMPDDVTGSLAVVPFGALLDAEDRRRETAALATALDPQGDGATVHWENAASGRRGALTAVGHAYPSGTKICRAFLGDLTDAGAIRTVQGTACLAGAGQWDVKDVRPAKRA